MRTRHFVFLCWLVAGTAFTNPTVAANWPAWRGPQGTGVCAEKDLPLHWSTNENIRWRAPLPERGNSTPVVWGGRLFVTQAVEDRLIDHLGVDFSQPQRKLPPYHVGGTRRTLLCFDRVYGRPLWEA